MNQQQKKKLLNLIAPTGDVYVFVLFEYSAVLLQSQQKIESIDLYDRFNSCLDYISIYL